MNAPDENIWESLGATTATRPRYRLQSADELANLPPLRWRVRGILPDSGLAAVYGASGSGKSFLVLDMAAAIAEGRDWYGARTKPCHVVYIALEGEHGISQRVRALRTHYGETLDGFHFLTQSVSLLEQGDIAALVEVICMAGAAGGMVIIDTLNRAAPGADENSSSDMGAIIENAKRLQIALGGVVLLVHHSGKDAAKGPRGHSSLLAALDTAIEVTRDGKGEARAWKVAKSKDGRDGDERLFRLEVVELGTDDEGYMLDSCVVVEEEAPAEATRRKEPKGGNQRMVLDGLKEMLRKSQAYGKAGAPIIRPCVELEAAVVQCGARLACEEKRRPERARLAITGLVSSGVVELRDGWIWLP